MAIAAKAGAMHPVFSTTREGQLLSVEAVEYVLTTPNDRIVTVHQDGIGMDVIELTDEFEKLDINND
eukprot:184455-Hanusia_phi.AAC.1